MAEFIVQFGKSAGTSADGRLDAPAFHRNSTPIWAAVSTCLGEETGDVLEVGSGTGQHIAAFASRAPHLTWWPSDIYDSHLRSIAAWRSDAELPNLRAPQRIDLREPDWTWIGDAEIGGPLAAILCINVLHISPWEVSRNLFNGAGRYLRQGGRLLLYGPFMREGAHTAPSNQHFDSTLRAENPEWGVRDVVDLNALAADAGLTLERTCEMPANNLVLVFARWVRQN